MNYGYKAYAQHAQKSEHTTNPTIQNAITLEDLSRSLYKLAQNLEMPNWEEILEHNQKIWSMIQAHITDPNNNALPPEVKANILSLSLYVDNKTYEMIGTKKLDKTILETMANVNLQLALGLRGNVSSGQSE